MRGKPLSDVAKKFLALSPGTSMVVTKVEKWCLEQLAHRKGLPLSAFVTTSGRYKVWAEKGK